MGAGCLTSGGTARPCTKFLTLDSWSPGIVVERWKESLSLWNTGVVPEWFANLKLPDAMKREESEHQQTEGIEKDYTDGSALKAGGSTFAGWAAWPPDSEDFAACGPLEGVKQTHGRGELRVLVAAVEEVGGPVEIITDSG